MLKNIPIWLLFVIILVAGFLIYSILTDSATNKQSQPNQDNIQNQSDTSQSPDAEKEEVQAAPDFTLKDLEGNTISLSDYQGKYVYLNFFATWCGPCRAELPDLNRISQNYQDKDLVVLAVNIAEAQDKVKTFITQNNFTFTVLLDQNASVAKTYKVSSIPISVFIDQEGVIVSKHTGYMTYEQMEDYVKKLLP